MNCELTYLELTKSTYKKGFIHLIHRCRLLHSYFNLPCSVFRPVDLDLITYRYVCYRHLLGLELLLVHVAACWYMYMYRHLRFCPCMRIRVAKMPLLCLWARNLSMILVVVLLIQQRVEIRWRQLHSDPVLMLLDVLIVLV